MFPQKRVAHMFHHQSFLLLAAHAVAQCLIPDQKLFCDVCTFEKTSTDPRDCADQCTPEGELPTNERDCTEDCVPRGTGSVYDICGVCGGDDSGCVDCKVSALFQRVEYLTK